MSLHLPNNFKLQKACRACLGEYSEMRPLYGSSLDDMLRSVAQINVQPGDGLPEAMCLQCVLQVSRAFRFKQQCNRSDLTLRNYLEQSVKIDCFRENFSTNKTNENIHEILDSNQDNKKCILIFEEIHRENKEGYLSDTRPDSVIATHNIIENDIAHSLSIVLSEENDKNISINSDQSVVQNVPGALYENICPEAEEFTLAVDSRDLDKNLADEKGDENEEQFQTITNFQCDVCNKTFPKRRMWKRHLKIHDPIKPHVCKECGMSFTERSNLKKHQKKHTGELRNVIGKPNLCSVCGKGFKWASSLSKHMNHHTKKKILNCPHCPKYYVEKRSLRIHLRTHTGEKPFVCDICNKGFTQMCNLEKHFRVHTGEKPFLCPVCGKGFSQSGYVAVHLRSHTGEKPYVCSECGKTFAGPSSLAIHKKVHSGDKPFTCDICKKAFARQESLVIHFRTHTGEKPHICLVCNRGFTSSSHLTIHVRTHTGERPYLCKKCPRKFVSCNSLKMHIKTHEKSGHRLIVPKEINAETSINFQEPRYSSQDAIVLLQEDIAQQDAKQFSILTLD